MDPGRSSGGPQPCKNRVFLCLYLHFKAQAPRFSLVLCWGEGVSLQREGLLPLWGRLLSTAVPSWARDASFRSRAVLSGP